MHYIGTRGGQQPEDFTYCLTAGLAERGGLFVPETLPRFTADDMQKMADLPYPELAHRLTYPFIGDAIPEGDYRQMINAAYGTFRHKDVTPIVEISEGLWGIELFHGQTLAFKDVALSLLGELSDYVCRKQGKRITIIGATSGDTGPAAMAAFANKQHAKMFMLYPYGRTSDIQRKQMTTLAADNVEAIAVKGSFDDCQDIAKALLCRESLQAFNPSAVNSINWGRIMAQIPYYAYAALRLAKPIDAPIDTPIDISVPTGNFGNILAAYCAKQMGFPIAELIIASNENDILTRFIADNDMSLKEVKATWSPSIDIQVSGNFERMLFWLLDGDGDKCRALMQEFRERKKLTLDPAVWQKAKAQFHAYSVSDGETLQTIKAMYEASGVLYDPHSAIAISAAKRHMDKGNSGHAMLAALTAHPAKFPVATEKACGMRAALPEHLAHLTTDKERTTVMENDVEAVADYIERFAA